MIEKVVIISNIRMLLLFLLINSHSIENALFILDNDIKPSSKIKPYIKVKKAKGIIHLILNSIYYFFRFKLLCYKLHINKKNTIFWGADHITGSKFFLKRFEFVLLEDGTINYNPESYKRNWKNKLFSIPTYGMHTNVSKIYLTQSENIPDCIKDKVEVIDLYEIWNKKNNEEKKEILNILDVDINRISMLKDRAYILYTQPLSEDGIISENEKIELYHSILSDYDMSKLVIKPHPRENTDYSQIFNSAYIFKDNIPSEILSLLDIEFDKAITLFSTAVLQHKRESVVCYGTRIHPKLYQHFGDIQL